MVNRNIILIPVRNCKGMIGRVLEEICPELQRLEASVVIIDNASNDGTLIEIDEKITQMDKLIASRFTILKNSTNIGYGGSIKKLFDFARDSKAQNVYLIHGDDQSNWSETLRQLSSTLYDLDSDVVICSRFTRTSKIMDYSIKRKIGNYFFKYLTNAITGLGMSDPGAAVMVFKTKILKSIKYSSLDSGYLFHPQLNIIMFASDLRITEIPIEWKNATKSEGLNLFSYGTKLFYYLTKISTRKHLKNLSWEQAVISS